MESLKDLHQTTLEWESSIEFWKKEFLFFKKLITKYEAQLSGWSNIQEKEHFKSLLNYYSGSLMELLMNKMIDHEAMLKPLLLGEKSKQDEMSYRKEHTILRYQVEALEKEFENNKNELYALIEKAMTEK
jgi:hypothetical protein